MRSPEQIAADLLRCRQDGDNNVLADPNLVREAAEALRQKAIASKFDRTNELLQAHKQRREAECACHEVHAYAESLEAERDALIAFAQAAFDCECPSWAWYRDAWNALPEPLRHRIEAG